MQNFSVVILTVLIKSQLFPWLLIFYFYAVGIQTWQWRDTRSSYFWAACSRSHPWSIQCYSIGDSYSGTTMPLYLYLWCDTVITFRMNCVLRTWKIVPKLQLLFLGTLSNNFFFLSCVLSNLIPLLIMHLFPSWRCFRRLKLYSHISSLTPLFYKEKCNMSLRN